MTTRLTGFRSLLTLLVVVAGLTASACATTGRDISPQEITEADLMIRRAVTAGAERLAPELLGSAREAFDAARRASFAQKQDEARRQLEQAKAYASAAELRATAEQRRREAGTVGQQADALDARLQDLQQRLRTSTQSGK